MNTAQSCLWDLDRFISQRAHAIDVSGIRRVFELGAKLQDPINLSIGQPDFPVPEQIKRAAINAIEADSNGYTLTQGSPQLLGAIASHLHETIGWSVPSDDLMHIVTSGTSGGLLIAFLALLNPGDEVVIPDPYFVVYPALAEIAGARAVRCDTYPDFRMTAERIEPLVTDRTRLVLLNSPANPSGIVLTDGELKDIVDLCERRNVLIVSDEIYDVFTFEDALEAGRCPTPARYCDRLLLVRGFGKTYGCTGWRMGYVAGPRRIVQEMAKLQQYTFVCAPSMAQAGCAAAFDIDMSDRVDQFRIRRDAVVSRLQSVTQVSEVGGAFYAFVKVPEHLHLSATEFAERAIGENVLVIPGNVFSERDSHFRISFAISDDRLHEGLSRLAAMMAAR